MAKQKDCASCGRKRLVKFFSKHAGRPDGLQGSCKDCVAEQSKKRICKKKRRASNQQKVETANATLARVNNNSNGVKNIVDEMRHRNIRSIRIEGAKAIIEYIEEREMTL